MALHEAKSGHGPYARSEPGRFSGDEARIRCPRSGYLECLALVVKAVSCDELASSVGPCGRYGRGASMKL